MGRIRTLALFAATICACTALLGMTGIASATTNPLALDGPENGNAPLVAYDSVSKTTFIAWPNPQGSTGGVDLCVLPAGAAACTGGGPVLLNVTSAQNPALTGDNTVGLGGLQVLPGGNVVVIGTPVSTGSLAWESDPTGAAFLSSTQGLENGGAFISPVSLFYTDDNTTALSATDIGILDNYGDTFSDSAVAGPESPAITASNSNQGNGGMFPRKPLGVTGSEIGAVATPGVPGSDTVVAVGDNYAGPSTTVPGCINQYATGFAISVGSVNGTSNATGTLNGEGIPGYGPLDCSAANPALASGGTDGIGVLEDEGSGISGAGSTYTVDFRPFVASATGGGFGATTQLATTSGAASDTDLVDDSGAGVYAMWSTGDIYVDYSPDGGAHWGPAVEVPHPSTGSMEFDYPVITGVGDGVFQIAFNSDPGTGIETYLGTYSYQQLLLAPTTLATKQTSGSVTGASISVPAGTIGESDKAIISGAHAAVATGTVAYGLYSQAGCTASSLVKSYSEPVIAGNAAATPGLTSALAQGTYYWKAAYTGDAANDPSVSSCGSEVLTIGPAASAPATATATTTTVSLTVTCSTLPCTVTVTITIPAAGSAFSSAHKTTAKKPITLATGRFSISKKGKHALKLKLTTAGKTLFKKDKKLGTTLLLSTKTKHGTFKSTHALKITRK